MSKDAFGRYAPFIQEFIYRKKWTDLREVQVEACSAILDTDDHVIIASGTASGKTEAAFFPILTCLNERPSSSVGVLYIGPLKALINDQLARLSLLLEESEIPVWPWHGDVSQGVKRRALEQAKGVLQITPESLEAMLMLRPDEAVRLFADLRFVVIDEVHAFMGTDRGVQLQCLLARLEQMTRVKPRRIGLSATLHDYGPAERWLSGGTQRGVQAVGLTHHARRISLCVERFTQPQEAQSEEEEESGKQFLYDQCHKKKSLIFTNSRQEAEKVIAEMKQIAAARGDRDVFYVHHGSISAALRQEAELALRDRSGPTVAAATLTLELGIDLGDLDNTIQIGAPFSCASFVQRLGRSGRTSGKSEMLFLDMAEPGKGHALEQMPWALMQIIAVIQLYIEERWVEPALAKPKPFSVLAHQTLSVLMAFGDLKPAELAKKVLSLPAFSQITQEEYRALLRHMLQEDYLERLDDGALLVGLKGEQLTGHYSFYAVFKEDRAYRVIDKQGEIGTLDLCPVPGEVFQLAGRAWRVLSVEDERKIVYVTPASRGKTVQWQGGGGQIHDRIVGRMRQVLVEKQDYAYLQPQAKQALNIARELATESGILDREISPCPDGSFFLCPWVGDCTLQTLHRLFMGKFREELEINSVTRYAHYLHIRSGLDTKQFTARASQLSLKGCAPSWVLAEGQSPWLDKYDTLVPTALLRTAYLENALDIQAAQRVLREMPKHA